MRRDTTIPIEEFERLRAELDDKTQQVLALQDELDETNRGVLALYAELDMHAEQLRDASQRSESKFRTIYAQAPSGIVLLDAEGVVVGANPAMLRLLQRDFGQVVGQRLSGFAPVEWAPRIEAFSVDFGVPPQGREIPMRRPDGGLVYLEWSVSSQIEPGVAMVVAIDVSERVRQEQQRLEWLDRERVARAEAEQTSRLKDDFIAVLSHELRTPLNAIMGWTHVLRKRGGTDEAMRGLAAIERNGTTQARMISDLLDMSRLNMGKLPLMLASLDPAEEIVAAVSALRPSFDEKQITVDVECGASHRPIRADSSRLQQVTWNLLSNAIKFSPPGSRIVVALVEDAYGLKIRFTDRGQGIAADFLPFVFDRFAQSDAASNRHRGGLGLGLAIVRQLVEAHGGTVSVSSEGLGHGATFEVWLPVDPGEGGPVETADTGLVELDAAEATELPLAGLQLLIVDDDLDARSMLQIILADRGAVVHSAADVEGALALLGELRPDALISDIGMPGDDGYDLIRTIRRRESSSGATSDPHRRMAAIALTSFTRPQDREQSLAAGFDAHCGKPLRPLNLVQQIVRLVETVNGPLPLKARRKEVDADQRPESAKSTTTSSLTASSPPATE